MQPRLLLWDVVVSSCISSAPLASNCCRTSFFHTPPYLPPFLILNSVPWIQPATLDPLCDPLLLDPLLRLISDVRTSLSSPSLRQFRQISRRRSYCDKHESVEQSQVRRRRERLRERTHQSPGCSADLGFSRRSTGAGDSPRSSSSSADAGRQSKCKEERKRERERGDCDSRRRESLRDEEWAIGCR